MGPAVGLDGEERATLVVCLVGVIGGVVVDGSHDQAPPSPAGSGVDVAGIGLATTGRGVVRGVGAALRGAVGPRDGNEGCLSGGETRCRGLGE